MKKINKPKILDVMCSSILLLVLIVLLFYPYSDKQKTLFYKGKKE